MKILSKTITLVITFAITCIALADELETDSVSPADWVLTGGQFYTVDDTNPWAQAVAIRDGKLIYVGDESGVSKYVSDKTRQTNLDGKLIIPGLVDSHTHPGLNKTVKHEGVLPKGGLVLTPSKEELMQALKQYADDNPDLEWVRMCCWPFSKAGGLEGPSKSELDAVVGDRPVWIDSDIRHDTWVNSKALDVMGVTRETPDPAPGVSMYMRDEDGELTGWQKELYWKHDSERYFPVNQQAHEEAMETFIQHLSQYGVTAVYDAGNMSHADRVYDFMARLEREGRLPIRYEGTTDVWTPFHDDEAITELLRLRAQYGGKRLRFRTMKVYMDGTFQNHTGSLLQPYHDEPDNSGQTVYSTEQLKSFLLKLHQHKIDLHVHAIGDKGIRTALDAIELAQQEVGPDFYPRITLAHLDIVDPTDYPRFKELGVIANYTPWWQGQVPDNPLKRFLGKERHGKTQTPKPFFEQGAIVSFSSDNYLMFDQGHGVGDGEILPYLSPYLGMATGHNRHFPKDWVPFYLRVAARVFTGFDMTEARGSESERLSIAQMIKGYTLSGAYQLRMEDQIGSIEVGKQADLVVLEDNLFEMNRHDIHKVKPAAVVMEGKLMQGAL